MSLKVKIKGIFILFYSDWDPMLSDDDLQKQFDRCQRQEQTFGDLFTGLQACFLTVLLFWSPLA